MQDHDSNSSPTAAQWIASYNKFYPICTEMAVTELDVNPGSGAPTPAILATQANQYAMLFKCFVERSYRSGRGKIVSVSKDGLNDQYAFVANASLWDNRNQCKPAFYAAVNVGINYNALDSLIARADTLHEREYTAESWANFAAALASAKIAMAQNYSAAVSAADALRSAKNALSAAIKGLVKISTGVTDVGGNHPAAFALSQNYPNPFNPSTQITYTLKDAAEVTLEVFDAAGRLAATFAHGLQSAGRHQVTFDAKGLESGVYFYRLRAGSFTQTKRMLLVQ
jgi:hypothetical protein